MMQKTVKQTINLKGIGLHSGCEVNLAINPAPENSGIIFCRTDVKGHPEIKALYKNVVDTRNCTCLGDDKGNLVSTIEHIMAALSVSGIDNAFITVDNQEIPIMDGSGKVFWEALEKAEKQEQNAPRKYLKIKKEISFEDEHGNKLTLSPAEKSFTVHFEIDFPSEIVGHQVFDAEIDSGIFAEKIAPCRTFCEKQAVDYLKSIGLIKGGSLENAIVLDGNTLLNPEGFRVEKECVNHKVLDAIGDFYTSGYRIIGKLTANKTGHKHNNEILKALFADPSNYEII